MKYSGVLLLSSLCVLVAVPVCGGTVRVPEDYGHLKPAIASAGHGDTVLIGPGTYADSMIHIQKNLTLVGVEGMMRTNVASSRGAIFAVDGVTHVAFSGLTLDGGGTAEYGIRCRDSGVEIEGCRLRRFEVSGLHVQNSSVSLRSSVATGCRSGVYLASSEDVKLARSLFAGNGVGIYVTDSSPLIESCRFKKNDVGIEIRGNSKPVIGGGLDKANRFQRPSRYGFHVRNLSQQTVDCSYNHWYGGEFCAFKRYLFGELDFLPYANQALTESYDDCP